MKRVLLTILVSAIATSAATPASSQIRTCRSVIGCGCGDMGSGSHVSSGTVGQPAIGMLSGASFLQEAGFWYNPQPMGAVVGSHETARRVYWFGPAHPNPFNPATSFQFCLPTPSHVSIRLFDVTGREVMVVLDGEREPGLHTQAVEASGLSSGVYFCRMEAGRFVQNRKLVLLK